MRITGKFVALWVSMLLVGVLLAQPVIVAAQAASDAGPMPPPPVTPPSNTVSCFDYYTFGSVQANLTAPVAGAVSGTPITFSGNLKNNNPYPIVDGALYVKIFKSRGTTNDGNGPDVVDQFLVKGDIVIPARGSVPISFQWKVPSYAASGDYSVATFFTASRKFNLLGLSFTDDVVGNTVPFKVVGETQGIVKFDKASVTINDSSYHFAAFPPRVGTTEPATLEAKVRNTTGSAQTAVISWVVYQWDAQLRENAIQEETRQVSIPANGSADVSIIVRDTKYPVYLAVGTLKWKDTQSVIGARFVRESVDRTRINFPGVMSFPLMAGARNTLFSCLHNSGESPSVPNGRLVLTLSDALGTIIHEYTYAGDITGSMMGVAQEFTPERDYDYFILDARLYSGEEFIDEAHLIYDCNEIDPSQCRPTAESDFGGIVGSVRSIAVVILLIIVLILAIVFYRKLTRRSNTTQLPPM